MLCALEHKCIHVSGTICQNRRRRWPPFHPQEGFSWWQSGVIFSHPSAGSRICPACFLVLSTASVKPFELVSQRKLFGLQHTWGLLLQQTAGAAECSVLTPGLEAWAPRPVLSCVVPVSPACPEQPHCPPPPPAPLVWLDSPVSSMCRCGSGPGCAALSREPAGGQQPHAEGGAGQPLCGPAQDLAAPTGAETPQEVQLDAEEGGTGELARGPWVIATWLACSWKARSVPHWVHPPAVWSQTGGLPSVGLGLSI